MLLLDGKIAAASVKEELKSITDALLELGKPLPHLAAILIGTNGASETYVASKVKNCEETGFKSTLIRFDESVDEAEVLKAIEMLNNGQALGIEPTRWIYGFWGVFLAQLLAFTPISFMVLIGVVEAISPAKDVDGFPPSSAGKLVQGLHTFIPATPYGILLMLEHFDISTKGKHAVVIGRSNIVGRPMSILLSSNIDRGNCTVTLCHSHTPNLTEICLQADIIVAALGKPEFVKPEMVKDGAVIIDVGITRVADAIAKKGFRIKGDVHFESVAPKCSAITPVPGGVGLMTIAGLLKNTMQAYENNRG